MIDGSVLASYGNVIVITLNYRVGVLGMGWPAWAVPTARPGSGMSPAQPTSLEAAGKRAVGGMGPNGMGAALWVLPLPSALATEPGATWQCPSRWSQCGLAPGTIPPQAHLHSLAQLKSNIGLWLNK